MLIHINMQNRDNPTDGEPRSCSLPIKKIPSITEAICPLFIEIIQREQFILRSNSLFSPFKKKV